MKRSDLPQYETTFVENRVTGRVGSVVKQIQMHGRRPNRKEIILKDRDTGELYCDNLAELGYEPVLEYPEINWGPHSVSYFGNINLELWMAFPEFPSAKWYGRHASSSKKEGGISEFIGWLEEKYDRNASGERIFGSRGGWRIYYCTVYIDRLPCTLDEFIADVENKIAELI